VFTLLEFVKIQGNGNDFVVIDNRGKKLSDRELSALAQKVCERRQSLGGDGLLVVEVSKTYDFKMRLFNSDGSEAEMCGNGARCIARYAQKKMLAGEQMVFETLAGAIRATVQGAYVELDMGEIHLSEGFWGENLTVEGMTFPFVYLVVGVPHCVLFVEDLHGFSRDELVFIGRTIRHDTQRFPKGTNVNFVEKTGQSALQSITYERGVEDLTLSCGTGSVASAIASAIVFDMSSPVEVHNPGGINWVSLQFNESKSQCHAYLKGKTVIVAEGRFCEEQQ
jgi:diaminopimelate epimerase